MRLAFVTTQTINSSTVVGRTMPFAHSLAMHHEVHVLLLGAVPAVPSNIFLHRVGTEPFVRTSSGKTRQQGLKLIWTMMASALQTAWRLWRLKPERIIIVKPLPANVLGVYIASWFLPRCRIVLDVDDFELTANVLTSLSQRAAVHIAERVASGLAQHIIAATPFLVDHFQQLTQRTGSVTLIPTGIPDELFSEPLPTIATHTQLAYIGSISISTGHRVDMLPAILAEVRTHEPDTQLHIIGSGDSEEILRERFSDVVPTEAISWHGRFTVAALPNLLKNCALIVDPTSTSIAERAKSSFRVAVAASLGIPVITSNIGIRPFFIPTSLHERLLAEPDDAAAYAAKIIDSMRNPLSTSERESMRAHARRYSISRLAATYQSIVLT